jgi:hypothetical protein
MGYVRGQGMRNNKAYHKQAEEIWWLFVMVPALVMLDDVVCRSMNDAKNCSIHYDSIKVPNK